MDGHHKVLILLVLAAAAGGCSNFGRNQNYYTITDTPHRDTERAEEENQLAVDWIRKGNWERAEAALQNALVADVTYGPAHNNLGKVYFKQGKLYLAAWEFQYANRLMPQRGEPYNNLGLVYEAAARPDDAISYYELAHAAQPQNPEFIGNLARARLRGGDRSSEVRWLLSELLMYDDRPDWIAWAKEQLAVAGLPQDPVEEAATIEQLPPPAEPLPPVGPAFDFNLEG